MITVWILCPTLVADPDRSLLVCYCLHTNVYCPVAQVVEVHSFKSKTPRFKLCKWSKQSHYYTWLCNLYYTILSSQSQQQKSGILIPYIYKQLSNPIIKCAVSPSTICSTRGLTVSFSLPVTPIIDMVEVYGINLKVVGSNLCCFIIALLLPYR